MRPRHNDPELPEWITPKDLERGARVELKTLSMENAEEVARHLAMVSRLIESDPELAHRHAAAAARRAGRIAIVRETYAITAYETGDFALALRELRTYRRISGKEDQLPLMVDSERGVGRPDRALELGRSVDRARLATDVQVALAIAMSGARLDLGQPEAALAELEIPQLDRTKAFSYSPALFDAYATVLEDLDRTSDAESWHALAEEAREALGLNDLDDVVEVDEEELEIEADAELESVEAAEPVDVRSVETPDADEPADEPVRAVDDADRTDQTDPAEPVGMAAAGMEGAGTEGADTEGAGLAGADTEGADTEGAGLAGADPESADPEGADPGTVGREAPDTEASDPAASDAEASHDGE